MLLYLEASIYYSYSTYYTKMVWIAEDDTDTSHE